MKDEDLRVLEKINRLKEERTETKWKIRYYEVKSYIAMLAIGLVLAWFVIFLILIGIL